MLSSPTPSQDKTVDEVVAVDQQSEVDEKLYSRQLYVLGIDAMKRMQQSNVLICGLGGLGVEVAKNVILTGVKSVTLHDTKSISLEDLSAQFYASEKDVGINRAEVSLNQLKELNPYVPVKVHQGELNEEFITQFSVVVFTDSHIPQLAEMNEVCHKHNIKFIASESRGLMGSIFCDFGTDFTVYDQDGENPVSNIVTDITNGNPATVTVYDDKPSHQLYDGDYVQFEGIEGMTEINNSEPIKVQVTGKHTFKILTDTTSFGEYKSGSGGYVRQVKVPTKHSYQLLKDQLANPTCIDFDYAKIGRPQSIHIAMMALSEFERRNQHLPKPYNKANAERLLEIAKEIVPEVLKTSLEENIVKMLSYTCRGNLNPMAAFLGGIVAQEVQKACSGKFTPLNQYLHFDSLESLGEDENKYPTEEDCQLTSTRYDGQIVVFGKQFQEKLANVKEFIVGAGALGCEYLKNYAMMGVGCGNNGKIFVTDMDSIEVSNLNRQFLFRRKHVGSQKSTTAAEVVKGMNTSFNVLALQDKVAPETEQTFDDEFWEQLTGVTNALDNVQARLYVDSKCVYYSKPLIESGTLGAKGNTQIVVPNMTESYGSTRDPPEKEIPICTLKNFPNAIEHTIQWARDSFEGLFNKIPNEVNTFLSKTDYLKELDSENSKKMILENIYESLVSNKPITFENCVEWARLKFEQLFNNNIQQLLYNFPIGMITSSGTEFWGGAKRPPTPLTFDPKDPTHLDFIIAGSNLRAFMYGLKGFTKEEYDFASVVSKIVVPEFVPRSGVKIQSDEKDNKEPEQELNETDEQEIQVLTSKIPKPSELAGFRLNVSEFEKDDDTNHHIDFIAATSNLRARNYKIPEADRHKTKGIAGKIIPAMVTTTALVTGLACLEFYKLMQGAVKIATYKNGFVNIALPFITLSEPAEPPKQTYLGDKSWTLWDRFEIDEGKDITLKELMDIFKERHKLEITMMSAGKSLIFSFFGNKKSNEEKMKTPISKIIENTSGPFLPKEKYVNLEVCAQDLENGDDQEVPYIRYKFRGF